MVLWGGVIVGAIKFLRGWIKASAKWRLIGTIAGIAIVIGGMMAFRAAPDIYNSAQVGDCVDSDGLPEVKADYMSLSDHQARLRMCDHKDIVGIPILTEEQLLATVRREQSSDASSE